MNKNERPIFPKRAIVTCGMPYGNKDLHFGFVFGMALQADIFARFLKCRIGKDNVIFGSGTDCYGSPLYETYRKKIENEGYTGTIVDLVKDYHNKQEESLKLAELGLDYFYASAFGDAMEEHKIVSAEFFEAMYKSGNLKKMSTEQFYDEEKGCFINGRQVIGECPIEGCKSTKAYSDECELGHQYLPKELKNPISTLSNTTPVLKSIDNWYLDMLKYKDAILEILNSQEKDRRHRKFVSKEIREFLKLPETYIIRKDQMDKWEKVKDLLPPFKVTDDAENKPSFTIQFDKLEDRELACKLLSQNEIRYRNGKTLVPFRISDNGEWGVPLPSKDGLEGRTFYVWPESLWAPISFLRTYLKSYPNKANDWRDWWCSNDAEVYQFLAEDNMYFYGPPQEAMFLSTQGENPSVEYRDGDLKMTNLIVNKHSLLLGVKASSSGAVRAPLGRELLEHYTLEQMRMHYLAKNLGDTNSNFSPKALNPNAKPEDDDPAVKEGNLLINIYNRILRKFSFACVDYFDSLIPLGTASEKAKDIASETILNYEDRMYTYKFHIIYNILDNYLRSVNKYYESNKNLIEAGEKEPLIDLAYLIRVANTLLYPIIPSKSQEIANFLGLNDKWTSWDYIFDDIDTFVCPNHKIEKLIDENPFFKKHPTQD